MVDFSVTYDELPIWQQPVAKLRWALSRLDPVSVAERPRPQGKRFALHPSDFAGWPGFALCDFNDLQGQQGTYPRWKRRGFLYRAVSARPGEVLPEFVRRHRQHGASKQVSAFRQYGML